MEMVREIQMSRHEKRYRSEEIAPPVTSNIFPFLNKSENNSTYVGGWRQRGGEEGEAEKQSLLAQILSYNIPLL